jgi:hypothetical protein
MTRQSKERCATCLVNNALKRVCPLTHRISPWYLDSDGCMTRTVEGGVCAKIWEETA